MDFRSIRINRRVFLAGSSLTVLAACGSSDDATGGRDARSSGADDGADSGDASNSGDGVALVRYFNDPSVVVGTDRRLAIGIADVDGTLRPEGPDEITAALLDADLATITELTGTRRTVDVALPYYEFRFDVDTAAIHTLRVDVDGEQADAAFTVVEPGALAFAGPGDPLAPFDTPTTDDERGVDPICTREPPCPFHATTLAAALAEQRPVVYLIGTPAFCQTGTCGPILDLIVSVAEDFPQVRFIHSEVYTDDTATTQAPAVEASGLNFEPAIFLTDASGTVVERIDVVVDRRELADRIGRLV